MLAIFKYRSRTVCSTSASVWIDTTAHFKHITRQLNRPHTIAHRSRPTTKACTRRPIYASGTLIAAYGVTTDRFGTAPVHASNIFDTIQCQPISNYKVAQKSKPLLNDQKKIELNRIKACK